MSTDEHTVARARAGDREALSAIAERAARTGLRTAVVALADEHLARDVSQEVAIRVLRNLHKLRAADRFDVWTYRIAVAEIRRAMGKQSRRREIFVESVPESTAAERLSVAAELREAIAELPERERIALALRYVLDLDDDEIASAMGCRPGTVRSLISRARAKLRDSRHLAQLAPLPLSNLELR